MIETNFSLDSLNKIRDGSLPTAIIDRVPVYDNAIMNAQAHGDDNLNIPVQFPDGSWSPAQNPGFEYFSFENEPES